MASKSSSSAQIPAYSTQTNSNPGTAPTVALVTPSTTQVPLSIVKAISYSVGEEPLYLVRMRDGTYVYMKESLLTQATAGVQKL